MRSFWFSYLGQPLEIVFSLIENGRWWYDGIEKMGIKFDYPNPESDNEIHIDMTQLEELDPDVRSMLFQKLKLDATEFNLAYS